jgi:hypothetical protein
MKKAGDAAYPFRIYSICRRLIEADPTHWKLVIQKAVLPRGRALRGHRRILLTALGGETFSSAATLVPHDMAGVSCSPVDARHQ